jgi:NADH-dependent peroxiredoxin subunit F
VVVGGGNSALEAIDDMLKIADRVYLVMETHFSGDAVLVDRITRNPKLYIYPEHQVVEIAGKDRVEKMTIQDIKTGTMKELAARGVFVEIGLIPNSSPVKDIARLNANGEIEVNCSCETNIPGLFAAGDVASTPEKQIIIAATEGAKAALQTHRYLQRLT